MRTRTLATLLTLALAPIGSAWAQSNPEGFPSPPHKLMLFGTFHFNDAGLDEFKPLVDIDVKSESRQRELEEVLSVLERFEPTRIAVEAKLERQDELDQRYGEYLRGEFELPANEIYQIGFRLAKRMGHDGVYAVDAERRWYEPYVDPEKYAAENGQAKIVRTPWYTLYEGAAAREDKARAQQTLGEILLAENDPDRIRMGHGVYLIGTFKAGVGNEYPGADVKTAWYNRNLRIFANVQRITQMKAERILVVIGAGHLPILRHCAQGSPEYDLVEPASLVETTVAAAPAIDAEALIRKNTYELRHDGALGGPGLDFLLGVAENAQFVLLGEPHNTDQVNQFCGMLFKSLHDRLGFRHLVTEQDGVIMDRFAAEGVRGDVAAVRDEARRNSSALHFDTDEELVLLAEAGRISEARQPIWGVDRVFDAELSLRALRDITAQDADRARITAVLEEAGSFAQTRAAGERFISSPSANLDSLLNDLSPPEGSPAAEILHALKVSREDLVAYRIEHAPGEPWGYLANERRENLMKSRFLASYRRAAAEGEALPKALAKLGHWHTARGHNPGRIASLGSFLAGVARFNGHDALAINIQPVNAPGRHWSLTDYPAFDLFNAVADPEKWQLVDLRPLRGHINAGSLKVSEDSGELIFGHDLLLLIGGTDRGEATWGGEGR